MIQIKNHTHHFFLVGRKTPIRFHNHGAQPHVLWVSALSGEKQLCQATDRLECQSATG